MNKSTQRKFDDIFPACLRFIQEHINEVYPLSISEWRDVFSRDNDAVREMVGWTWSADVFSRLTADTSLTLERKIAYFDVILACSAGGRENFSVPDQTGLTAEEIASILATYFADDDAVSKRVWEILTEIFEEKSLGSIRGEDSSI